MPTEFYSHSKDNQREIHFLVQTPEVDKLSIPDLSIKSLISDAFTHIDDRTCEKDVLIRIKGINEKENKLTYEILSEKGNPTHEIALSRFNNETLKDIGKRHIVSKDEVLEEDDTKSLLDRFSTDEKKSNANSILSNFFAKIRSSFQFIDRLLDAIYNRPAKKLKWDLNCLSEVCGAPPVDGMPMRHALKYMSQMLMRERDETTDPILLERISDGAKLAENLEELRNGFSPSKFQSFVGKLQNDVRNIDQKKLLIPVGYTERGKLHEMLIEISKANGKYTISFISGSDDMRNLFDREMGVTNGTQALRRTITGINESDLLAALPLFIELQTSPPCFDKKDPTSWREIFLQNMKFDGSWIAAEQTEEKFRSGMSPGHLGETISYVRGDKNTTEEGQRLELSLRLRFFLDICKRNKQGMKNKQFRDQVRVTALHLASAIENEKKVLGAQVIQGQEMTRIYGELKQLIDTLESTIPELIDLRSAVTPLLTGAVEMDAPFPVPALIATAVEPNTHPEIDPPLLPLDANDPVTSINNWNLRIRNLIEANHTEQAALEAKLMVRMLPKPVDPFWSRLDKEQALQTLNSFCTLSEAITRSCFGKSMPSLNDIASVVALNFYGNGLSRNIFKNERTTTHFLRMANKLALELLDSRLPEQDKTWLRELSTRFPKSDQLDRFPMNLPPELQAMLDLSQMATLTAQRYESVPSTLPPGPLTFYMRNFEETGLVNKWNYKASLLIPRKEAPPIALRGPKYAETLSKEICNRYLSEFCCLGCIRDNCPVYNMVNKKDHRFHPLYMLHNNVDIFCKGLVQEGELPRDEVSDLMYTQQTNQNANSVWEDVHDGQHGFNYATGFNPDDHHAQMMNTISLFCDRPHYFRKPELRWHFEMKVFGNETFNHFLEAATFKENRPFLVNALNRLSREISISYAAGNKEVTAYLISIADHIDDIIENSSLDMDDKEDLKKKISVDGGVLLLKMVKDVVGKTDSRAEEQQRVIIPIFLELFFKKFITDCNNPEFEDSEIIEVIVTAIGRLESIETGNDKIDPEIRDRYQTMMQWLHPKIKERLLKEENKGEFVNKILMVLNPQVAALRLEWEPNDYPTVLALDAHGEFYQFDLSTGRLTFGRFLTVGLPDDIRRNPDLVKIFGDAVNDNWQKYSPSKDSGTEYIVGYIHKDFPDYRVIVKKGVRGEETKVVIERSIQIAEGKTKKLTYVRFKEQDRLLDGNPPAADPDVPLAVAVAIGDRSCWVDSKQNRIYVLDSDNKELFAKINLRKKWGGDLEITDVLFVKDKVHLLDPSEKDLECFTNIEKAEFIQVTGQKDHPSTVTYPRYELANKGLPISYQLEKKGITSPAFPGYYLAPVGVRPGLADSTTGVLPLPRTFDTYQLLTKDGSQKVLIPLCEFEHIYSVRGEQLPITKTVIPDGFSKRPIYEFSVDPETNRLTAQTGDAYCYLAYLNIAHQDYASALFYLEKAKTCSGYTGNYQITNDYMQKWQDESPNGIAMKLKFELFNEKVLEDSRLRQIAKGNFKEVAEIEFTQLNRLAQIAELYKKYQALVSLSIDGETGIDPALVLSGDDTFYIAGKVRELIKEHGDQPIDTGEPVPVRAEQIRLQTFAEGGGSEDFELNKAAFVVWTYAGNSKDSSPLGLNDPRWVVQNFRKTFNQILNSDVNSVEFKEIANRLRMVSERPQGKLADDEFQAVQFAQSYLLRLVTMKSKDPNGIKELKKAMGSEKLPESKGSFFKFSRVSQILRMEACQKFMDKFSVNVKARALTKAKAMTEIEAKKDCDDLRSLGKKIYRFVSNFSGNQKEFKAAIVPFILREIYGTSGASSIQNLSTVFNILDKVPIEQPKQSIQSTEAAPKGPQETYRSRYEKLIETSKTDESANEIFSLEKKISERKIPEQSPPAKKTSTKLPSIIGETEMNYCLGRFKVVSKEESSVSEKLFDELAEETEPAFVRVAEENRRDMNAYVNERREVSIGLLEMHELKDKFENDLTDAKRAKEKLQKNLLQYVDMFKTPAGIVAMRRLVGQGVKPSIEFLVALWRKNEITKDWKDHPLNKLGLKEINKEQLEQLDSDITQYLELSTKIDHLERLVSMGDSYIDSCGDNEFGDSQLASEVYDAIGTERQFVMDRGNSSEFRDFLFLEYSQRIILRKPQVETLREMSTNPNAVRQLIMGGGKSKVLLPMLAKRKATGKNLVMLMLPEELYETNCRDLDNTNRQLFGQEMHRFNFSRSSDMSKEALIEIYRNLLKTINDQGFVMTTKRSMLSFRNAYLDLLYKLQQVQGEDPESLAKRDELVGQIRAMSKIMNLFNKQTDVIADEVDACLDVRKEVNFALGQSERADQLKVALGSEIIQMILSAAEGTPLHTLGVALHHNTQAALSPQKRVELLKEVARNFYDRNKTKLSKIDKEAFVAYVMDDLEGEDVEKQVFEMKIGNNPIFKRITAFKGFMNRGFGTTLGRVGNVNYGRDPVSEKWTIPYMASNAPHIGSEFDDDIERICFTYQDYIQNGVSYKQIYQLVARLFNQAQEEMRSKQHVPGQFLDINDTVAAKEFNAFLQDIGMSEKMGAISLSSIATPKRIEAFVALINESPTGKISFCQRYILANMEQYPSQINSISADLVEMVDHFAGFTGTPWNLHTYHDKIQAEKSIGVDGKTWALMLGRDVPIHTFNFDAESPIDSLLSQIDIVGNYQAVIDTGAYLRGTNNRDFVDKCFEKATASGIEMQAGIYFDDTGRIVKKTGVEDKSLPIEIANETDKMKGITLYDQAHTVGADIKQGKKARAVVTIGENTFIRDLFQAVWRLRQLHQDQRVSFAVSKQIRERILNGESRELTTEDILKFCLRNEANREGDDNYRAEREKINGYARRATIPKIAELVGQGIDTQQIVHLANNLVSGSAGLFLKERPGEDAFDQYGKMKQKKAPSELFDHMKENAEKKCAEVATVLKTVDNSASEYFTQKARDVAQRKNPPKDWCPKEVDSIVSGGGEVEQEAQAEVEQELELMIETEINVQVQVEVETLIPKIEAGEASHGNVYPLGYEDIRNLVRTNDFSANVLRSLSGSTQFFDSNIYCSAVFERNLCWTGMRRPPPQAVFYSNRKPVKTILFAKDQNKKPVMIIPTIHEAHAACRQFIQTAPATTQAIEVTISKNAPMVLYKTGGDRSDALVFTDENDRKEFYSLYIQAKLFNGEIDFNTEEEKEALKTWLIKKGPREFKTYFEQNILAAKPKRFADAYPKSSLFKIINELLPVSP